MVEVDEAYAAKSSADDESIDFLNVECNSTFLGLL